MSRRDSAGFESYALRGATALLGKRGVDFLIIEFDPRLQDQQRGSALGILQTLHGYGYILFENSRLAFDAGFSKLSRQFKGNWGAPQRFDVFVQELRKNSAYTDLIAVHQSLLSPPFFFV